MKKLSYLALGCTFLSGCNIDSQTGGTLMGAAGGAAIGGMIGRGWGGAIIGAAAGGILGNIIGKKLSKKQQQVHENTFQSALERNPRGARRNWSADNANGWVEPGVTLRHPKGYPCREFTQTIVIDGKTHSFVNRACRIDTNKDGSGVWVLEEKIDEYIR